MTLPVAAAIASVGGGVPAAVRGGSAILNWLDSLIGGSTESAAPKAGQKVFWVYGGDSAAGGASWSPVNPANVPNFRNVAGLPSGGASGATNAGRFVIEGTLQDAGAVVKVRPALPLDGNAGGLTEYIIPNWQKSGAIRVDRVSGVNPEF